MNSSHLIHQQIIRSNALVFFSYPNRCPLGWPKLPNQLLPVVYWQVVPLAKEVFLQAEQLLWKGGRGGGRRKEEKLFWRCDVCKESTSFERAVQPLVTFASSCHPCTHWSVSVPQRSWKHFQALGNSWAGHFGQLINALQLFVTHRMNP